MKTSDEIGNDDWYWTAGQVKDMGCTGSDGRLYDYTVKHALPMRPYEPGSRMAPLEVLIAIERMVAGTDTGEDRNVVRHWLGQ